MRPLEEKRTESEKAERKFKHLMNEKLAEQEKQVLEMRRAELEFQQLITGSSLRSNRNNSSLEKGLTQWKIQKGKKR